MRIRKFFLVLFFCIIPTLLFAGKSFYVDCSANVNGNGSFSEPWNNIKSVNNKKFATGDDVYFKVNTTCKPSVELIVDWDGTIKDRLVIGAYYGEDKFGLNGKPRPILDGGNTVPTEKYNALIRMTSKSLDGHVTIQNLRINNSQFIGILTNNVDDVIVDNNYIYRSGGSGIALARCNTGRVINNRVEHASTIPKAVGAAIEITGMKEIGATTNITVEYNTVSDGHEGIGIYKKADGNIVQFNTIYDCHTYHVYLDSSKNNIVRYNLVYKSIDGGDEGLPGQDSGIVLNNESWHSPECYIGDNVIFGNLVAGFNKGINISNEVDNCSQNNNKIFSNTLVDNNFNIWFAQDRKNVLTGMTYSGNEVKNNIFWTITAGAVHSNVYTMPGVIWDNNNFDDAVKGDAKSGNAQIYRPNLTKISGWRSLKAGTVNGAEFNLQPNSQNMNNGLFIAGYNDRIFSADFDADPITVKIKTDDTPSIGAWMEVKSKLSLMPPKNLNLTLPKQTN